ncbi:hypothetical protein F5878DRAFT_663983 [Lentinula raphanica]|uniref:Uncharacterized protein n=1 Tax=Lentinula raphanica TaxID=153919 RepID=A0AA38P2W8_9AGAR|nr:hypothetical protein F5878DRAFT_663983 [Lentinula raphanica]
MAHHLGREKTPPREGTRTFYITQSIIITITSCPIDGHELGENQLEYRSDPGSDVRVGDISSPAPGFIFLNYRIEMYTPQKHGESVITEAIRVIGLSKRNNLEWY